MPERLSILISGGGIAGPAVGFFLSRAGHRCTIVEKAPQFRQSGQQIDVDGEGLKVVQAMGIEEAIRSHTIGDDGLKFVDSDDQTIAQFPAGGKLGIVKEIEILRPKLANIMFDATRGQVEYKFDEHIKSLEQHENKVVVTFATSERTEEFDYVVAADGLRSSTRDLAFDPDNTHIHSLGQFGSFFTIPWKESDGTWSRWYNAPGGRTVCIRPDAQNGNSGAYLCQITDDVAHIARCPREEQLRKIPEIFSGTGWETERILHELRGESKDSFYLQEVAQAKSKSLASGRVALVGDAGYCPSPVSGQGTTLALIGAYILAGCIATYDDPREAMEQYEKEVRPFVDISQKLPPGAPQIVNPQSAVGISVLNNTLWVVGKLWNSRVGEGLSKLSSWLPSFGGANPTLPEYPLLQAKKESS